MQGLGSLADPKKSSALCGANDLIEVFDPALAD
jgi:hypothetical protein